MLPAMLSDMNTSLPAAAVLNTIYPIVPSYSIGLKGETFLPADTAAM